MKAAFEEWYHWLEDAKHPFTVLTDHCNLEYLKSAKRLNHRQARWSLFFTRFDFTVTYCPGSLNTKADALSRQYESSILPPTKESIISPTLILAPIQCDIMTEIMKPPPAESPPNRTYVPHALRHRVIQLVHSTPSSGHPGIAATIQLLTNRYWWPTLQADTIAHIRNCPTCNMSIFSPTSCRPLTNSAHSSTPLVSYSHRFYYGSATIQRFHHHPHGNWPLFQGLSIDSSAQTAYSPWNRRIIIQPHIQILWSAGRYSLRSGTTIHLPCLVCLLS